MERDLEKEFEELLDSRILLLQKAITTTKDDTGILVRDFAKLLTSTGILKIGQNQIFKWLRSNHYINYKNVPYSKYMNLFSVREVIVVTEEGNFYNLTPRITYEGQLYFGKKLLMYFLKK